MADNKFNIADAVRLAAAATRAAAGDYTGIAVEGVRHAGKIAGIVISITIGVLIIFTVIINTLSSLIPGFDHLYDIYRKFNPPVYLIDYSNTWQGIGSFENIYFPIPHGYEYSLPESKSKYIEIHVAVNTPVIAVEDSRIIDAGTAEIKIESADGLRRYRYRFSGIGPIDGRFLSKGSIIANTGQNKEEQLAVYTVKFEMWLNDKNKWIQVEPYQFLRMLSFNRYVLPDEEDEVEIDD